jgi:hypothetical protein
MTVEQLLDLPNADLAAMSDDQLVEHLRPYFPATRAAGVVSKQLAEMDGDAEFQAALEAHRAAQKKGSFKLSAFNKPQ